MKSSLLLILVIGSVSMAGCNFSPSVQSETGTVPTLGRQLIDLQKTEQAGVITPEQYEAKKAELLKGNLF